MELITNWTSIVINSCGNEITAHVDYELLATTQSEIFWMIHNDNFLIAMKSKISNGINVK